MWSEVQSLGAVLLLPPILYLLINRCFLSQNQKALLILNVLFLLATTSAFFLGGWLSTISCLLFYGMHNLTVMEIARGTELFRRSSQPCQFSKYTQKFFTVSENQFKLVVYLVYFWIGIRALSLKSYEYDLGGGNFVGLIDGWNCLLGDWTLIYGLWLFWSILALYSCIFLVKYDRENLQMYKQYVMRYKVVWDLLITSIVVLYQFIALLSCDRLRECLLFYDLVPMRAVRCVQVWGLSASTLWFFWKCAGKFEDRRSSETNQTENEGQEEIELNEMMLEEGYRERSSGSERNR